MVRVCVAGWGHVAGGMHDGGVCLARGHAWKGGMHGGGGACVAGETATAVASYWNAFLFSCFILEFLACSRFSFEIATIVIECINIFS